MKNKYKYIAGFICIIMLVSIPLTVGQAEQEVTSQSMIEEPDALVGVAFIAGVIMNPEYVGNTVNAKALILAYYDRGLIFKDSGIAVGYKNVRFRDGNLLYMSEPNNLGMVQVAGICTGFSIQE